MPVGVLGRYKYLDGHPPSMLPVGGLIPSDRNRKLGEMTVFRPSDLEGRIQRRGLFILAINLTS